MRGLFTALVLSLVLSIGLVPSMAFAAAGSDLTAAAASDAPVALTVQATATPKIAVKRAATSKVAVKVGKSYKLGAKTNAGKLSFKSSNKKVAKVSSKGVVKTKRVGKATITVTAKNGSKKTKKKVRVTVLSAKNYKAVKKIKAKASKKTLFVGKKAKIKVTFTPSRPSNRNVIYKSSNPKVLKVSASGKIKAIKAGKAKVTVTSCANAKAKASVTIKVKTYQPLNRSKWNGRMHLPTNSQVRKYRASERSPYLDWRPEFPGTTGCYEYAVDFKVDSQPRGTYLSIGQWCMDVSDLRSHYASVSADAGCTPGLGYAGFQVLDDGSKVAIMSVWKMYVTNSNGTTYTLNAKRTYPANPRVGSDFGGEGTGVKTIVDYNWRAGRTYRALIQCHKTDTGNCELLFWVCDLTTGRWSKLVAYDLGFGNTYMTGLVCFLENFLIDHAAEIRTAELSNFRAYSREKNHWVSAKSAIMANVFGGWPGSYNYGSDNTCFWAVATGVPNLCSPPANYKRFYVSNALEGSPY